MLRMSKMADYGTVILITMVRQPQQVRSAAEVAAAIRLSVPTVSKILKILAREGLLISLRGAHGGYMLARPPAQISIAQIIHAMDGPIGMTECSIMPGLCLQENSCPARTSWQRVNRVVLQALHQISLEQMIQPIAEPDDICAIKLTPPSHAASAITHQ